MQEIFQDKTLTTILVLATLVAMTALYYAIRGIVRSRRMRYWGPMLITIEDPTGKKYSLQAADLKYDDLVKLLGILESNEARRKPYTSEAGVISIEALLMVVPAFIALLFVCTILFMAVNENNIPEPLVNWLTVIIGYYFGVGANSVTKGKALTPEQAQQLLLHARPGDNDVRSPSPGAPADRKTPPSGD